MSKVRVAAFSVSLDGFSAGRDQDLQNPLGVRGGEMFNWFFQTQVFQSMHGSGKGGNSGVDNDMAKKSFENVGAWILGRNMFSPYRGPWEKNPGASGSDPSVKLRPFVGTEHIEL